VQGVTLTPKKNTGTSGVVLSILSNQEPSFFLYRAEELVFLDPLLAQKAR
jgi:hypothetical protein